MYTICVYRTGRTIYTMRIQSIECTYTVDTLCLGCTGVYTVYTVRTYRAERAQPTLCVKIMQHVHSVYRV